MVMVSGRWASNPDCGQLNSGNNVSLSPFGPVNLVSRDRFSLPVSGPAHERQQIIKSKTYNVVAFEARGRVRTIYNICNSILLIPCLMMYYIVSVSFLSGVPAWRL